MNHGKAALTRKAQNIQLKWKSFSTAVFASADAVMGETQNHCDDQGQRLKSQLSHIAGALDRVDLNQRPWSSKMPSKHMIDDWVCVFVSLAIFIVPLTWLGYFLSH